MTCMFTRSPTSQSNVQRARCDGQCNLLHSKRCFDVGYMVWNSVWLPHGRQYFPYPKIQNHAINIRHRSVGSGCIQHFCAIFHKVEFVACMMKKRWEKGEKIVLTLNSQIISWQEGFDPFRRDFGGAESWRCNRSCPNDSISSFSQLCCQDIAHSTS